MVRSFTGAPIGTIERPRVHLLGLAVGVGRSIETGGTSQWWSGLAWRWCCVDSVQVVQASVLLVIWCYRRT